MKPLRNVLVMQTAFIGDAILATAMVEKLYQHHPEANIDLMVKKGHEGLFLGHPFLRQVLTFDKANKRRSLWQNVRQLRSQRYDLLVNAHRHASSGLMAWASRARQKSGFAQNPFSFAYDHKVTHQIGGEGAPHEVERNQQLLTPWTDAEAAPPKLYPTDQAMDKVAPWVAEPFVTISPASVWFTKAYPVEGWRELVAQLGCRVLLLGAPGDQALCEAVAAGHARATVLAGQLSLLESAALMARAKLNYVNDSAGMHLCSAVNAPVCAVYCSTVPSFGFGPLSTQQWVVQTPEELACRPCGLHGHRACPEGHFRCATTISSRQLAAAYEASSS